MTTSATLFVGLTMLASVALGLDGCPEAPASADTFDGIEAFETGDESSEDESTGDGDSSDDDGPIGDLGSFDDGDEPSETGETGELVDTCGDFAVQPDEQCDGWNTNFETCKSLGYVGGELACHEDCTFDVSDCFEAGCGNGVIDTDELCDGTPYPCWVLGYAGGSDPSGMAPCQDDCTPGETACDSECEWGEPGCFCVAATPCPSGYTCAPHPQFPGDAPGTCKPVTCEAVGESCFIDFPAGGVASCCPGLECVDHVCV